MNNHSERNYSEISYKIIKGLNYYSVIVFMIFFTSNTVSAQTNGSFKDKRDGKSYKWVKIGNQTWMAENLAYSPKAMDYYNLEKEDSNLISYGCLYKWETAQNVCPAGWHLPESKDFEELAAFIGSKPGIKLKAKTGWLGEDSNGTDEYCFSAVPAGHLSSRNELIHLGYQGYWWSATKAAPSAKGKPLAFLFYLSSILDSANVFSQNIEVAASVRCIRDK
jgi:uncharacterized protein (TIGR02145 family)